MGADVYYKVLKYRVLSQLKSNYPNINYVLTQDGAPAAKKVQKLCEVNIADIWPANF